MKAKYRDYCPYFEDLYSFVDNYISHNIHTCNIKEEWNWLYIYPLGYVKNLSLEKTFQKFKIKKNTTTKENMGLIAYLSNKIKYSNLQEHYLILYIINNILYNTDNINTIMKSKKFSEKFNSLQKALSYLSFNMNYSINFNKNMPLINQDFVSEELFKANNILLNDIKSEYFWIPKNIEGYNTFTNFIFILDELFKKFL